jgi:hypothetical protein
METKHEFEHVSKLVKLEVARFEQERIEDFKDSLHAFLEGMIQRQQDVRQILQPWNSQSLTNLTSSSRLGKTISKCC